MYCKKNIRIMYTIALLQGLIFYAPIATLYRQAAGIDILQIAVIESISFICQILLEVPWGIAADKIGYKKTMVINCSFYFISKIIFWQASGFTGFLLERILLGFVCAGLSGCDESILFLSCEKGKSQKVFTMYFNLSTLGLVIAAFVYSVFIRDHYRLAGFLTVISYGLAAVLSFCLKEISHEKAARELNASIPQFIKGIITNKRHLLLLTAIACLSQTHQTITVFLSQLQYLRSGISPQYMGIIYIGINLVGFLGLYSVRLSKWLGEHRIIILIYGVSALSCCILVFSINPLLSILCIILLRISFNLFSPLSSELQNREITTSNRATALSYNSMYINSMMTVINIIFGRIAEENLSIALAFGMFLCILGGILIHLWFLRSNYCKQAC